MTTPTPVPPMHVIPVTWGEFPQGSLAVDSSHDTSDGRGNIFTTRAVNGLSANAFIAHDGGAGGIITGKGSVTSGLSNGLSNILKLPNVTGDIRHFMVRAVEGLLGLLLVIVGVAKLTDAVPIASKVGKVFA